MATKIMTCPCGNTAAHEDCHGALGLMKKLTGFYPIFTDASTVIWLCPSCMEKAMALALELETITGREDIYYLGLVQEAKKKQAGGG